MVEFNCASKPMIPDAIKAHGELLDKFLESTDDQGARLKQRAREVARLRHALKAISIELATAVGDEPRDNVRIHRAMRMAHDALWREDDAQTPQD